MFGKRDRSVLLSLTVLTLLTLSMACGPKAPPEEPQPEEPTMEPQPREPEPPAREPEVEDLEPEWEGEPEPAAERLTAEQLRRQAAEFNRENILQTVYFETDKSELQPDARRILAANAGWLRGHPDFSVLVEGHCDERNTEEYNLALGERRAEAVRNYLVSLGVESARVETISYGEERPAAQGHTEAAWSQNRRAEFEVRPL